MIIRRLLRGTKDYLERAGNPWFEAEKLIYSFTSSEDLAQWTPFSDSQLGGLSTAALALSETEPDTAVFSGNYSRTVPESANQRLKRSGFAGITSQADPDTYLDLDDYDALVFRVKGDGRKYIANIRTDNWVVGDAATQDVWQAFLFARKGEWQEVEIPLERFLLTWRGKLVETRVEMNPGRITSVGISLAGGDELQPEGGYRLGLEWVAARNMSMMGLERRDEE